MFRLKWSQKVLPYFVIFYSSVSIFHQTIGYWLGGQNHVWDKLISNLFVPLLFLFFYCLLLPHMRFVFSLSFFTIDSMFVSDIVTILLSSSPYLVTNSHNILHVPIQFSHNRWIFYMYLILLFLRINPYSLVSLLVVYFFLCISLRACVKKYEFAGSFATKWLFGTNRRVMTSHSRNPLAPFFPITRMAAILDFKMAALIFHFCGISRQ